MKAYGKNMRRYQVELSFLIDEDKIRTDEEIKELLEEIFNTDNCKFWGATVIDNECEHEWKRGGASVSDPDGWYYGKPCWSREYICTKCGRRKYEDE